MRFTPAQTFLLASSAVALAATAPAAAQFAPAMDHHQHLLSPAGAALNNRAPAPAISLPAEFTALLERRAAVGREPGAGDLYLPDAAVLDGARGGGWIQGADEVVRFFNARFRPGYVVTPVSFHQAGDAATISGYYSRSNGDDVRHVGYVTLGVVRQDGTWRIASETPVFPGPTVEPVVDADALVAMLDAAGIRRAVVYSDAYYFDGLIPVQGDSAAQMRAENDWTADQVARHPDRLVAFCSFNPLRAHALSELERCRRSNRFKGVKLHLGTSGVDLDNPAHVEAMRNVFAAIDRARLPVVVHLAASERYGRGQAETFLNRIVTAAPHVPVIVAHLWGGASYSAGALAVYADAVAQRSPAAANLYFELAQASLVAGNSPEAMQEIAGRIRQIGLDRIFYGSDGPQFGGRPPREIWSDLRMRLPLTEAEFRTLADNVAPFLR